MEGTVTPDDDPPQDMGDPDKEVGYTHTHAHTHTHTHLCCSYLCSTKNGHGHFFPHKEDYSNAGGCYRLTQSISDYLRTCPEWQIANDVAQRKWRSVKVTSS